MKLDELEAQHPGLKAWLRDMFVGNECDSDEYRETQPAKGLAMIGGYATLIEGDEAERLADLTLEWLQAGVGGFSSYAGTDQLEPILRLYFDALWAIGQHPYYEELDELQPWIDDFVEEQEGT